MPQAMIEAGGEYDLLNDSLEETSQFPNRAHSVRRKYMGGIRTKRELEILNRLRNLLEKSKTATPPHPTDFLRVFWTCFICEKTFGSKNGLKKHKKRKNCVWKCKCKDTFPPNICVGCWA